MSNDNLFELIDGIQNFLDVINLYRHTLSNEEIKQLRVIRTQTFNIVLNHQKEWYK